METVKVAVIGYGHLGKWHCDKVVAHSEAELVFIVEPLEANRQAAQEKFPTTKVIAELDDCLDMIDAAVVVTPTSFHFSVVEKILKAGKHIFCEKPVTSTFAQAKKLIELQTPEYVFQVGQSERFHQLWQDRDVYTPFFPDAHVEINRYAAFKGRATDVDVVQDLMIHDIDLLFYLFKEYPTHVSSRGHKIRTNHWDSVISTFKFASGITVTINVGRNHCQERRDVTFYNSKGVCVIDLMNEKISIAYADQLEIEEKCYERKDHLLVEHTNFYQSITKQQESIVPLEQGAQAVKIVEGVLVSLKSQGEFISL